MWLRPALSLLVALCALAFAANASASPEDDLAQKFAPVVQLVEQPVECGPGEPYEPTDVDVLFGSTSVAFRGPWNRTDLVKVAPLATDLRDRYEYHLDFPGDPLDPGCTYELWSRRITEGTKPTVYAHVAKDPAYPGQIALQYWFFYVFNDFNNTHEGDWEMIQLNFDAKDAAEALTQKPALVGYSSHEGAEKATWGEDKLTIADGTHPVVFPAAGSHANKYTAALYLGSSAEAGVGCDNTQGPHREVRPVVKTIPGDPAQAEGAFPWIVFQGRWGELEKAFFNGPTGPNMKDQWYAPITWSQDWRATSYAVPASGLFGTGATDLFCTGVEKGSKGLVLLIRNPSFTLLALLLVIALVAFAVIKATWHPVAPLRLARRRSWGQVLSSSADMYVHQPRLLLGIGLLLIPVGFGISLLQWLLLRVIDLLGVVTGQGAGTFALLALWIGMTMTLLSFGLVQAAVVCALAELDGGRKIGPIEAYRIALRRLRPLLRAIGLFVLFWIVLTTTTFLIPVALWLAVRWCLLAPAVEIEGYTGRAALRRSSALVRRRWIRVASLVGVGAVIPMALGPLLGVALIFATSMPPAFINVVAGLVYALAFPFAALVTAYVYYDARVHEALEPAPERRATLPPEAELGQA